MEEIYMAFPNKHYFSVDLSNFPKSVGGSEHNEEVYLPLDKPAGYIESTIGRKNLKSKMWERNTTFHYLQFTSTVSTDLNC